MMLYTSTQALSHTDTTKALRSCIKYLIVFPVGGCCDREQTRVYTVLMLYLLVFDGSLLPVVASSNIGATLSRVDVQMNATIASIHDTSRLIWGWVYTHMECSRAEKIVPLPTTREIITVKHDIIAR